MKVLNRSNNGKLSKRNVARIIPKIVLLIFLNTNVAFTQCSVCQCTSNQDLFADMKNQGIEASITIFPVNLAGNVIPNGSNVIGLFLEKTGMRNLETSSVEVMIPDDADNEIIGQTFNGIVAKNPVGTDYALYIQINGSPCTGIQEIRTVIVNRDGELVWLDRQTPESEEFQKSKPRNPMASLVFVSERMKKEFGLVPPPCKLATEGKFEKMLRECSGVPDKAEFKAMKKRLNVLKQNVKNARVLIFPVKADKIVEGKFAGVLDEDCAKHLVELIGDQSECTLSVSEHQPDFEIAMNGNEQKVLWDLARAFRKHVKENSPGTDYALYAHYILSSCCTAYGVHFVVCDRQGEWVIVDYQNRHHADFQSINPKTPEDCDRLVAKRFNVHVRQSEK